MVRLPRAAISAEGITLSAAWVEASPHTMAGKGHRGVRPAQSEFTEVRCEAPHSPGSQTCAPTYVQDKYGRLLDTDFYFTSTLNSSQMNTKSP